MFREMRRKKQLLPQSDTQRILENGITGILGVLGDNGYPYTVPINYVYSGENIYFHCAKAGHKIDAIRACDKVSFCVIDKDQIVPKEFTAYFRSVIAFGRASEVNNEGEKLQAMRLLNKKYSPGLSTEGEKEIEREWIILTVIKIQIEHITGKEAIELVKQKLDGVDRK